MVTSATLPLNCNFLYSIMLLNFQIPVVSLKELYTLLSGWFLSSTKYKKCDWIFNDNTIITYNNSNLKFLFIFSFPDTHSLYPMLQSSLYWGTIVYFWSLQSMYAFLSPSSSLRPYSCLLVFAFLRCVKRICLHAELCKYWLKCVLFLAVAHCWQSVSPARWLVSLQVYNTAVVYGTFIWSYQSSVKLCTATFYHYAASNFDDYQYISIPVTQIQ